MSEDEFTSKTKRLSWKVWSLKFSIPIRKILTVTNWGYEVIRIRALKEGEEVGYIKASYVPQEVFEEKFPSPFHFKAYRGWISAEEALEEGDFEEAIKQTPPGRRTLYNEDRDDLTEEERERIFDRLCEKHREMYEQFQQTVVANPFVDYVFVEREHRRNGIALKLYEKMGRYLAREYDFHLRASTLQQECAVKVWDKMEESGEFPIDRMTYKNLGKEDEKVRYLDYRQSSMRRAS